MKTITVKVTLDHIYRGQPENPARCPIALAVIDMGFLDVAVGDYLDFDEPGDVTTGVTHRRFNLSREACHFVRMFDNRDVVEPAEFVLEEYIPSSY